MQPASKDLAPGYIYREQLFIRNCDKGSASSTLVNRNSRDERRDWSRNQGGEWTGLSLRCNRDSSQIFHEDGGDTQKEVTDWRITPCSYNSLVIVLDCTPCSYKSLVIVCHLPSKPILTSEQDRARQARHVSSFSRAVELALRRQIAAIKTLQPYTINRPTPLWK